MKTYQIEVTIEEAMLIESVRTLVEYRNDNFDNSDEDAGQHDYYLQQARQVGKTITGKIRDFTSIDQIGGEAGSRWKSTSLLR